MLCPYFQPLQCATHFVSSELTVTYKSSPPRENGVSNMCHKNCTQVSFTEAFSARFIRAVSELELLGFIKPSKQKTDHVARLTWGGC